jgi:predicted phage-related endonuclease
MILPKVALPPEIEMLAGKYAELNITKSHAEKEMKSIRQELLDFTGPKFSGTSDNYSLLVSSIASSMTVDGNLLRSQYPDVYPMVLKERAGYSKLEVKQVKHSAA